MDKISQLLKNKNKQNSLDDAFVFSKVKQIINKYLQETMKLKVEDLPAIFVSKSRIGTIKISLKPANKYIIILLKTELTNIAEYFDTHIHDSRLISPTMVFDLNIT
jgi:hypothetical protein